MHIVAAIFIALALSGCAAIQAQMAIDDYMAQFPAKREAWKVAIERLQQMCKEDASDCRMRLLRMSNTASAKWETHSLPPYRVVIGTFEEEIRQRTKVRLADEYVLGISRTVGDLTDEGRMGEEEARLTIDRAFVQGVEMVKQDISMLRESQEIAQLQDQTDQQAALEMFGTLVDLAAIALNAYTATLPAQVRVPSAPAYTSPTRYHSPVRTPTTTVQCTYRLNALAGMMLCVNSDGSVVAR